MKYRKKQMECEVYQYKGYEIDISIESEVPNWVITAYINGDIFTGIDGYDNVTGLYVKDSDGLLSKIKTNDFIVLTPYNEIYHFDAEYFYSIYEACEVQNENGEQTYESVEVEK